MALMVRFRHPLDLSKCTLYMHMCQLKDADEEKRHDDWQGWSISRDPLVDPTPGGAYHLSHSVR
jgi:hypothetical protein